MVTKVLDPSDIAKSEVDEHGGYDLIVDMNQIGLPEESFQIFLTFISVISIGLFLM